MMKANEVRFSAAIRNQVADARDLVADHLIIEMAPQFAGRIMRGEVAAAVSLCLTAVNPEIGADGVVYAVPQVGPVGGMLPTARMYLAAEFIVALESAATNLHCPVLELGEYIAAGGEEIYLPEETAEMAAAAFAAVLAAEEQHRNWAQSQGKEVPAWLAEAGVLAHLGRELCEIHKPPPPPQDSGGEAPPSG